MPKSERRAPSLFFVIADEIPDDAEKPENQWVQPRIEGYALVHQDFKNDHPEVLEYFSRAHIQVMTKGEHESSLSTKRSKRRNKLKLIKRLKRLKQSISCKATIKILTESFSSPVSFHVSIGAKYRPDEEHKRVWLKSKFEHFFQFARCCFVSSFGAVGENILEAVGKLVHNVVIQDSYLVNDHILPFVVGRGEENYVISANEWNECLQAKEKLDWSALLDKAVEEGILHIAAVQREARYSCACNANDALSQLFFSAIYYNIEDTLRTLVQLVAKYDTNNNHNINYLLRQAVIDSSPGSVELLLGLRPSVTVEFNQTTFHIAFIRRQASDELMKCFEKMEEYGFNINFKTERSSLLLFGAITENWPGVVQSLLENGADPNEIFECESEDECGCMDAEDEDGNWRSYSHFRDSRLRRTDFRRYKTWTPLHMAIYCGAERSVIELLLAHGANVSAELENRTPIHAAIMTLSSDTLEILLARGVDINLELDYTTLLFHAIRACNLDAVKLLISSGANVNAKIKNRTLIHHAIRVYGSSYIVEVLIASGVNVRHNPELMSAAVEREDSAVVEVLLLNRTPLSMEESELRKLLALACATSRESTKVVKRLFKFGAQPNAQFTMDCGEHGCWNSENNLQILLDYSFTSVDFVDVTKIIRLDPEAAAREPPALECYRCHRDKKSCLNMLARHVIKRESAKLSFVEQSVLSFWHSADGIDEFRSNCEAEVAKLRSERVGDSHATYYDILTSDMNRLARYAKHNDFTETMNIGDYKTKFPIYASILSCHFKKGSHRKELLKRGSEICSLLNKTFNELPVIVKEEILKNLNNYNLEVLKYEFGLMSGGTNDNSLRLT